MRRKSIVGAAAAGAALAVGLAGQAQAAGDPYVYTTNSSGIMYYIENYDDYFKIQDMSADGYGIRGELRSGGGTLLSWDYVEGKGEITTWWYDLAKGKNYVMRVCRANGALGAQSHCASLVVRDS